jgi:hypothetical protein
MIKTDSIRGLAVKVVFAQSDRYRGSRWAFALLLGANMAGCAIQSPAPDRVPESCMAEQSEIERLRQLLEKKDALIHNQQVHQQEQAKELQATSSQATLAQVKLRRMATQPDAASTLAEVEVLMETFKSDKNTAPQQALQTQAQRLLDAANAAYAEDDYATAVDRAAQSREIIDMAQVQSRGKKAVGQSVTIMFQTPIPMRTLTDCNLRQQPRKSSALLSVLKKDSALTAVAYDGDWLRVQTEDEREGWLLKSLVEVQTGEL